MISQVTESRRLYDWAWGPKYFGSIPLYGVRKREGKGALRAATFRKTVRSSLRVGKAMLSQLNRFALLASLAALFLCH